MLAALSSSGRDLVAVARSAKRSPDEDAPAGTRNSSNSTVMVDFAALPVESASGTRRAPESPTVASCSGDALDRCRVGLLCRAPGGVRGRVSVGRRLLGCRGGKQLRARCVGAPLLGLLGF